MEKVDRQQALPHAVVSATGASIPYVPVEWFKGERLQKFWPAPDAIVRTFASSGTSQQVRSQSKFSTAGLAAYRQAAVQNFSAVLQRLWPEVADVRQVPGISLIPTVDVWPDSSLAQMLGWFAEEWSVDYVTVDQLVETLSRTQSDEPQWLFGTAAHWQQVDAALSQPVRLSRKHFVFETGGSKNLAEPLDRSEFYRVLGEKLGIDQAQIVSEYGMSELAAQAYDFVQPGTGKKLEERSYQFASDVKVAVMQLPQTIVKTGFGALLVDDPNRLDLPYPLRTQDMVELFEEGRFQLRGRVPQAELRGCSLRVQTILSARPEPQPKVQGVHTTAPMRVAYQDFAHQLRAFLQADATVQMLTTEFGSIGVARAALEDVVATLPISDAQWATAVKTAVGSGKFKRWLVIAPGSHSIAPIYPMVLGALAGFSMTVRLPQIEGGFLAALVAFLQKSFTDCVHALPNSWRIHGSLKGQWDAILAFGADATLDELAERAKLPVAKFGDYLTVTCIKNLDLATVQQAVRDAMSLGQRGCMSSRALIIRGFAPTVAMQQALAAQINAAAQTLLGSAPALGQQLALDHESLRYQADDVYIAPISHKDLVLCPQVVVHSAASLPQQLSRVLSERTWVLPIIWLALPDSHAHLAALNATIEAIPQLALLTSDAALALDLDLRPIGEANRPVWDGMLQGVPLFAAE